MKQGVPRVDDSGNPSQNREPNVDPKVCETRLSLIAMSALVGPSTCRTSAFYREADKVSFLECKLHRGHTQKDRQGRYESAVH